MPSSSALMTITASRIPFWLAQDGNIGASALPQREASAVSTATQHLSSEVECVRQRSREPDR